MISTKSIYDDKEKIWRGLHAPLLYDLNTSLGSAILEALMKDPNHITQVNHMDGRDICIMNVFSYSHRFVIRAEKRIRMGKSLV